MPPKRLFRHQLKKGDSIHATVVEVAPNCIVVSFLYQQRKFCGALLDTTKRYAWFVIIEYVLLTLMCAFSLLFTFCYFIKGRSIN